MRHVGAGWALLMISKDFFVNQLFHGKVLAVVLFVKSKLSVCIIIFFFKRQTSLRRRLSAGVQSSSALPRPAPSRCPSGCPAEVDVASINRLRVKAGILSKCHRWLEQIGVWRKAGAHLGGFLRVHLQGQLLKCLHPGLV